MSSDIPEPGRLERLLASLLHFGTWLASIVIAVGVAYALIERYVDMQNLTSLSGTHIVTAGIALFILLPVVRVIVMLVVFVRDRDYPFIVIAALVLMIILLGFALGTYLPSQMQNAH